MLTSHKIFIKPEYTQFFHGTSKFSRKNGNILIQIPWTDSVILFLLAIPVIYFTDVSCIMKNDVWYYSLLSAAACLSLAGQIIRAIAIGTSNKNTSGRNTQEQVAEALNTKGIYSTVRHPLYLEIISCGLALCFSHSTFILSSLLA